MAEINFINTDADALYKDILTRLENSVAEPLYPGDERRIFGEALVSVFLALYAAVNDAARQKLLRYARGEVLDAIGENLHIDRQKPVPAKTLLRFTTAMPNSSNIIIPAGVKVTGDYARYFVTDGTAALMAGDTYVDVSATSTDGGTAYNGILPGSINAIVDVSKIPLVSAVENLTATDGGSDYEEDTAYRDRIRSTPDTASTAGPVGAYRALAVAADPLIADAVVETPSPGTVLITPICYDGGLPDAGLLDKVLKACSASDVRPLTDYVVVQAPSVMEYDIDLVYYTIPAEESGAVETVEGAGGAIDRYIYWQSSSLDQAVNPDQLRRLILSPDWAGGLTGASRVVINKPEYMEIGAATIAKFSGSLTVSHVVKGGI